MGYRHSTKSSSVIYVDAGEVIQGWTVPTDGWLFFDETGQLGVQRVYTTEDEAVDALARYVAAWL